ncbi:MAG TPA: electron transfer flavoprotein subunit beta/FixA family protein [Acidimicrobiia bacterium]|nr:electron transfer flavoprotein subunit beta/FixA family protein [Acidimicrobiia bacterium]
MTLNIAVVVKQIPDPSLVGELDADFRFVRSGKIVLDDADLYGVEVALQLRDAAGGGEVCVVSMAPEGETAGVRTALAMGADKAIVVSDDGLANSHALATAKVLSAAINKMGSVDLIIAGTESSDGYTGTIPAQIAALRKVSALTFATSVELNGQTITIKRQSNEGVDVVQAALPAVVSVTAGVVEPRYPNFKGIMAAKSKPCDIVSLGEIGIDVASLEIASQRVTGVSAAPDRSTGVVITDVDIAADKIVEFLESLGAV